MQMLEHLPKQYANRSRAIQTIAIALASRTIIINQGSCERYCTRLGKRHVNHSWRAASIIGYLTTTAHTADLIRPWRPSPSDPAALRAGTFHTACIPNQPRPLG